jgi:hypothetical protein
VSSSAQIRDAIVAIVSAVPGVGLFHEREKYTKTTSKLKDFYVTEGQIAGGFVRRVARRKESPDAGHTFVVFTTWELHYFCGFQEGADSEVEFDELLDAIDTAFDADQTLGGTVDTTVTDEQSGLRLLTSQPAMFAGVLVHYAKLRLISEHTEMA